MSGFLGVFKRVIGGSMLRDCAKSHVLMHAAALTVIEGTSQKSLEIVQEAYVEPFIREAGAGETFQFVRNGYFHIDPVDTTADHLVINRTVALKSSFKPVSPDAKIKSED